MATLVLGAVGGVVAGPIGAALGSLAGHAIDAAVLRPAGRQGPRLADLKVQTSSYGTSLPSVWGTMRVAGCVIWSTDLIESHASASGGKGQPSTTSYSYAASFAVALSARPVRRVARIWADGNLLRGAAGDWKSALGAFRLHPGDEAQAVDPLIASAEGSAPAHRGMAYAVFEQLQLADFGNRIPSLTFELVADDEVPSAGGIAAGLSAGRIDGGAATMAIPGFVADGDSVRGVVELLGEACGGWWAPAGDGVRLATGDPVGATIAETGPRTRSVAAIDGVPKLVSVSHYDPARDYQAGVQRARRPGAGQAEARIELAAALDAGAAKAVAEAALARREAERTVRTLAPGLAALGVTPGDVVAIAGENGSWRITEAALEGWAVRLTLVPLHAAPAAAVPASAGRVLAAVDRVAGRTVLHVAELPPLGDALLSGPRLVVAAAGSGAGWRRASLLLSTDGGARWQAIGATAAPATVGTLLVAPGAAGAMLEDRAGTIEVMLANDAMTLAGADGAALAAGANLALVGEELLQFGDARQIAPGHWRLARLWRGRRGSEAAIGAARAGDRFVLLGADMLVTIDLPAALIGGTAQVMAAGLGDGDSPPVASAAVTGVSVTPPSPVALHAAALPDGGVRLGWTRRSRVGWSWADGGDAPLGEEQERYRLRWPGGERVVEGPDAVLSAAELGAGGIVEIRQLGTCGAGAAATIDLSTRGERA